MGVYIDEHSLKDLQCWTCGMTQVIAMRVSATTLTGSSSVSKKSMRISMGAFLDLLRYSLFFVMVIGSRLNSMFVQSDAVWIAVSRQRRHILDTRSSQGSSSLSESMSSETELSESLKSSFSERDIAMPSWNMYMRTSAGRPSTTHRPLAGGMDGLPLDALSDVDAESCTMVQVSTYVNGVSNLYDLCGIIHILQVQSQRSRCVICFAKEATLWSNA